MKNFKLLIVLLSIAIFSIKVQAQVPTISSFSPTSGAIGTIVTLTGTNFNTTAANNIVYFGATRATVSAATATSLTVAVPFGASYKPITILNTATALTGSSAKPFVTTFTPNTGTITTQDFIDKVNITTGTTNPSAVSIGDMDGDGKPDLVVLNTSAATVSVYRNTSTSGSITTTSFADKVDFATATSPGAIAIGDLDGDGKLDIAINCGVSNIGNVSILRNTSTSGSISSSSFAAGVVYTITNGGAANDIAIADMDGDGKFDLVLSNTSGFNGPIIGVLGIFRNTSTVGVIVAASFASKTTINCYSNTQIAIGDMDGDGKPDIVTSSDMGHDIELYRNTTTPGSITASSFPLTRYLFSLSIMSVAIGDLDGDNKPDLAIAVSTTPQHIAVARNSSTPGSFIFDTLIPAPTSYSQPNTLDFATNGRVISIGIADLNGDSKPDLFVSCVDYPITSVTAFTVSVFRNTAVSGTLTSNSFAPRVDFEISRTSTSYYTFGSKGLSIGDLDGNGIPDIVVAGNVTPSITIIHNTPTNTSTLSSSAGTDSQSLCVNTAMTNITYATTGATGATFSGLPTGVTGVWAANIVTISGTPSISGIYNYTVTLTGGCKIITAIGSILVDPLPATLSSAVGTNSQTNCNNTAITNITYTTTRATGATFTGLPTGVTGVWAADVVTISGTPSVSGTYNYTVNVTGSCGTVTATGSITVTPNNTITLSSGAGTNAQTKCINSAITNITYTSVRATGATFSGLPTGVSGVWAANVVTISGTPSVSGTYNYIVTLTGGCGTVTATGSIIVTPNNTITLSSAVGTDGQTLCINTAISNIKYNTTGATGAAFSGLPTGVTGVWGANVVTVSGTPSVSGTYNYVVTLTSGCGTVTATGSIIVNVNTAVLSSAVGTNSQTKCINTAITNITYTTTGATGATFSGLPSGVTGVWAANLVTISGTPSVSGTYNYTITLTGGCGTVTATGSIIVNPNNTITLTSAAGTNGQTKCINTAITNITYTTTGATGATFSGFPTGMTGVWAANVVTISGTPSVSGTYNYVVTLTGGCGTVTATGSIIVTPNNTITLSSAAGTDSQTKCINTAITNITYTTTGATGAIFSGLPSGVTGIWAANVVTISGTPSVSGTNNYTITLTGGCGTVTATGSIIVNPNNSIILSSIAGTDGQTKCINMALTNITYTTTGATGATFSGFPTGMTGVWAANVITISGTPSVSGTYNYIVTLTGGCGTVTATGSIIVTPNNTITLSSAAGTDGQTLCINTAITNIKYNTTGATGATFSGLPTGVTGVWGANVVTISGTPSVSGSYTYVVTLSGGCGTVTATGSIIVNVNTAVLSSAVGTNSQTKCINTAITNITYTTTGATGATFSGLPTGVTGVWAANVVTISGTPSVSGTYNYTITLTGGCGTATVIGSIIVNQNNTITLSSAAGTDGQTLCINSAITNITYATTGATGATFSGLPTGVTGVWAANVVTVSGTPSVSGTYNYILTLIGGCETVTAIGSVIINVNTVVLTSAAGTNIQTLCINTPITNITYTTTGATGATFSGLPTGVTGVWAANVVTISGTPSVSRTNNYTITLTGGCGTVTATGSIIVTPNNTITLSSSAGTESQSLCINSAITNIKYNTTGATGATFSGLPTGVTGNWTAGNNVVKIIGTPSVSGTYNYVVTLTGGCGTATETGSIIVAPNNTITFSSAVGTDAQIRCINTAITNITYGTTGATGATFSGLPTGVTGVWAANVVTISGMPSVSGTYNYIVTLTGGCGSITATGSMIVTPNNTITLSSAVGTDVQTNCINTSVTNITYTTSGATGATFSGLPTGVTGVWAANVVTVSGIPSMSGTYNYVVTLTGGCGTVTATGSIIITPNNTIILSSTAGTDAQTLCVNTALNNITYTTTGATGATFSGLPSGVTGVWAANVITISGLPSVSGTTNYEVTLTGGCGTVVTTGSIIVTPNNTITLSSEIGTDTQTPCNNTAITDITYTTTGATGVTFSGLPTGVTGVWAANVVTISGTPSGGSRNNYTITLTGGCGIVTATGSIIIPSNNRITLNSSAATEGQTLCVNTAINNITYSTNGATGATFSGLPTGVTGVWISDMVRISGTPSVSGTYNYRITLTGGCGTAGKSGSIIVNANTSTLSSAAGTDGQTKCVNTAITNITYNTTGATGATFSGLPTGVTGTWAANVVTISGTSSVSGTYNYVVTLTGGCRITVLGSIIITPNNTKTLSSAVGTDAQTLCINTAITNITYTTTGATGATFSGLPTGVTGGWAANVVTISGTPSVSGTYNYTITLTGGCGAVTATGSIIVNINTAVLSSAAGTDSQTKCINTALTNISYTTTGATGATFSGLPTGVMGVWAANVVTISGTPSLSGTYNYTITLTGGCGTVTAMGSIIVNVNTAVLSSAAGTNTQTKCINSAITNISYTTVGATGASFSGLPSGVTGVWAANVITISGTPSVSGTYNYTVTLTGGCGIVTATGSIIVTPNNTLTLTSSLGTYAQTLCINTAITNITCTTTGATGATFSGLPTGVTGVWAANLITVSGTPSVSGTYNCIVTLTGGCGAVTATGSIIVNANTSTLSSVAGTDGQTKCVNTAITNITYTTTGATGATFSGLPTGVAGTWAANVVTISGTPSVSGTYNYVVNLTGGCRVTVLGSIIVTPNNTKTLTSAVGTDAQTLCVNTAITNITYTTTGATGASFSGLPSGVTGVWAANVITISGTPSVSGTYNYTITLTGGCGTVTAMGSIIVNVNAAVLSSAAGSNAQTKCINSAITNIYYTTIGATGATFSGFPSGVTGVWAANVITISGTPSVSGTYNYTITLTGGCGTVTVTGSIIVSPNNTITLSSAVGSNAQTKCVNTALTNITYSTARATGAIFSGLPTGVTGVWAANVVTISGMPLVSGTYNYIVTLTGGCETVTAAGAITIVAITWTGLLDTLWNNPNNWSCGNVPTTTSDVIIASGVTNQPVIISDITINSLTINTGASLTVPSGIDLTVTDFVHNNGTMTVLNNANLIQANDVSNTGNITVKRDSAPLLRLDHTFWSSPVTGIQTLQQFSPNTLSNRFYTYTTSSNSYTAIPATSTFAAGKGFAIRASNTHSSTIPTAFSGTFVGVPNNGSKSFTLATDAVSGYNYNLVGNPYPSTIDVTAFLNGNSNVVGTIYYYTHSLTMNAQGLFPQGTNYSSRNRSGFTLSTLILGDLHPTVLIPSGTIQVGQGFLVRATNAGTVTFTNAMRRGNNDNQFLRTAEIEKHRIWLNLKTDTGSDINQMMVGYVEGATQAVDTDFDGLLFGCTGSSLASKLDGANYGIQGRSLPFASNDVVPLAFKASATGNYMISLTNTDGLFAGSQDIYVRDNLMGTDHNIKVSPYTFSSDAGTFDSRFQLVYIQALGIPSTDFTPNSVIVYKNTDWFYVNTKGIVMKDIQVYDVAGRLIFKQSDINATTAVLTGLTQTNEVLFLKITSEYNVMVTVKVIN